MEQVSALAAKISENRRLWRLWWLRQLYAWHWISAALSLAGMLLFAVTGITLNHAASIPAEPVTVQKSGELPPSVARLLAAPPPTPDAPLPPPVAQAVREAVGLDAAKQPGEWSDDEVYVPLPRPGGDAWVSIARADGAITAETTDRGWISYFNDLHKGRNAGKVWFWFIDVFAAACIVFTVTGLLLLQMHAPRRRATWPLVGVGILTPILIAALLIHS